MIQRTLVLLKPDAIERALVGECIKRFEQVGLKIVAMKMVWIDKKFAEEHYIDVKQRYDQRILDNLTDYLKAGPIIAMVLEGVEAIATTRKLVGSTYPFESAPGTVRGDFAHISKAHANEMQKKVGNLIHASANEADAKREIALWFKDKEMHSYKTVHEDHVF